MDGKNFRWRDRRSEAEKLANGYTPSHSFDLKKPEGRAARLAQLEEAVRAIEDEERQYDSAVRQVYRQLLARSKRRAGNFMKKRTLYEREYPDIDWKPLVPWRSALMKANRIRNYIRAMRKADAGAENRRQRKLLRDREAAREPWAREARRARYLAEPPMSREEQDARNAKRRARYQALKETPQWQARREARNARDRKRHATRKDLHNARRRARYLGRKSAA